MEQTAPSDAELRRKGLGKLAVLHDYLISYVTFLLDLDDVVRLSCCSRLLRMFACEEPLWLGLCLKLQDGLVEYQANWRQTALAACTTRVVPPEAVAAAARPLPPLPGLDSMFLYKRWYRCHVDLRGFLPPAAAASVERVSAAAMTPAEFAERYDRTSMPVVMSGLQQQWPADAWTLPALSAAFPSARFKVSKPHGGRALMTMSAYVDYMARQADEEPLYVFDATFAESAPGMRQLYDVPHVFSQDYFSHLLGARPHYRWLVLGPARAGASWHIDPALTSAWNALLSGRKRWALYPPHIKPPGVALDDDGEEAHANDDALTSLQWFLEVYPSLPPELRPIEFLQDPGEVVFVPGGWWHCVLNLETSVAVTQNYVGDANLDRVIRYMAHGSSAFHAHPLTLYDRGGEVAAWAARYPHFAPKDAPESGSESEAEPMSRDEPEEGSAKGREGAGCREPVFGVRGLYARRLLGPEEPGGGVAAGNGGSCCHQNGSYSSGLQRYGQSNGGVAATAAGVLLENGGVGFGGLGGGGGAGVPGFGAASVLWRGELEYEEVAVWRRDRPLGRWLRRLWQHEPHTRPVIEECLSKHLHASCWRQVLLTIAQQHSDLFASGGGGRGDQPPPEPTSLELMPFMGSDALVFLYGGVAVKIFAHEVPAVRGLMCALEATVPRQLLLPLLPAAAAAAAAATAGDDGAAATSGLTAPQLPQPLACGTVAVAFKPREHYRPPHGEQHRKTSGSGAGPAERAGPQLLQAAQTGGPEGPEGPAREEQALLYVVQQQLQGSQILQELMDLGLRPAQLGAVAQALGDLIGSMHATTAAAAAAAADVVAAAEEAHDGAAAAGDATGPYPSAPLGVEEWEHLTATCAVWHDRYGHIWVSGLGCVSFPLGEEEVADMEPAGGRAAATAATAAAAYGGGATVAAAAGSGPWACSVPVSNRWWPFLQHLRKRQRALLQDLPESSLPGWVQTQLLGYLPADPAQLLAFSPLPPAAQLAAAPPASHQLPAPAPGCGGPDPDPGTGPGVPPLLIHGDVTAHNVVVEQLLLDDDSAHDNGGGGLGRGGSGGGEAAGRVKLSLVDFSDAGHGDPLYEMLPVMASCMVCSRAAMERFWAAYRRRVDPAHVWPQRRQHGLSLAYCALCYCLIHDEAELLLRRVWEAEGGGGGGGGGGGADSAGGCVGDGAGAAVAAAALGGPQEQPTLEALAVSLWGFLDEE